MSVGAIDAALSVDLDDGIAKAVLVGLANHTKPGAQCFPGIRLLTIYTGFSERAVRDAIKRLEKNEWIRVERRKDPNNPKLNLSSLYFLNMAKLREQRHPDLAEDEGVVRHAPGNPSINTIECVSGYPAGDARGVMRDTHDPIVPDARASSVPADWKPSKELIAWCEERFPNVDIDDQLERFILINEERGTQVSNIEAAFKRFMMNVPGLKVQPKPKSAAKTADIEQKWSDKEKRIEQMRLTLKIYRRQGRDEEADAIEAQIKRMETDQ